MMVVVLVAGIGLLLAGLVAIGYGVPINEFGFGNTLILAGTVAACTGAMLLGLWAVVREFRNIAQRFGLGLPWEAGAGTMLPPAGASLSNQAAQDGDFLFTRDQAAVETAGHTEPAAPSPSPPPWHEETASRDRVPPPEAAAAGAAPKRRNLLFSSSSRKERERAQARLTEPTPPDIRGAPPVAPPAAESSEAPPATFDDAWPKSERSRADAPLPRRSDRTPSTFTEPAAGADRSPPPTAEEQPPVTVLKSGVVDGMAYSLYSDGSIEAQMPEGMMRFASIDELRTHLDQRA